MAAFLPPLLLLAMALTLTHADPRTDLVWRYCGTDEAQDPLTFSNNFEQAIQAIPQQLSTADYSTPEVGDDPNRVFVLAQCMDDLNHEECGTCFATMTTLLTGCLPNTSARVYLDGCFARFENYSFYHETLSEEDQKGKLKFHQFGGLNKESTSNRLRYRCSTTSTPIDAAEYRNLVRHVVFGMADVAPEQSNFAVDQEKVDFMSVYGLAMCAKTLDSKSCSICLEDAATNAYNCLPAAEGRALNAGCFLRYSNYEFVNSPKNRDARETVGRYISYTLALIAICGVALLIGCSMGKLCYQRTIDKRTQVDLSPLDQNLLQFKGSTLEKATKNFDEDNKLGSGGYGEVFKGTLPDGREIAIKRLYVSGETQVENIYNEMDVISRAQHKNLVRFLGCCFCNFGSFLLYEYLPNRSLDRILFGMEAVPVKYGIRNYRSKHGNSKHRRGEKSCSSRFIVYARVSVSQTEHDKSRPNA
ncbi:hypothetical protein ACFE04_009135 [Oxalis oulophora]